MIKSYLRIAFRSLGKNKTYAFINILGLSIGFGTCLLLLLYAQYEQGYDAFHRDADLIYRVAWISDNPQTRTPHPMAQGMVDEFPEVESAVSLTPLWGPGLTRPALAVRHGERQFDEDGVLAVDSTFFDVFDFKFLEGSAETALAEPGNVVITKATAEKYFETTKAIGRNLVIEHLSNFQVSAVIDDVPNQSHFYFDFLVPYTFLKGDSIDNFFKWGDFGHYNYIKLREEASSKVLQKKIAPWTYSYVDWTEEEKQGLEENVIRFELQPLRDIHLRSHLRWELEGNGDIAYVRILWVAAIFILIIACINFMNLSTALATYRAKEIGIRKMLGSAKKQFLFQFLGESLLYSAIALLIGLFAVELLLPAFNAFTGKAASLAFNWTTVGMLVVSWIVVGLISGIYPALFMSSFRIVKILRESIDVKPGGLGLRKLLLIFQFGLSIALIIATLTFQKQIHYLQNKSLGFEQEQLMSVAIRTDEIRDHIKAVKSQLVENSQIKSVSAVSNLPGGQFNQHALINPVSQERISASDYYVDEHLINTLGIEILEGRNFVEDEPRDSGLRFIINESMVHELGFEDPVGQKVEWDHDDGPLHGEIIGIVSDFHFKSLHNPIQPLVIVHYTPAANYMLLRVDGSNLNETLAQIEELWSSYDPEHPFQYSFLSSSFDKLYTYEEKTASILSGFSILSIWVAALGLLGLISFDVRKKFKEIGIRKVLGAPLNNILFLLSKNYILLLGMSFLVAIPVVYLFMENWLSAFAYHIQQPIWLYLLSGLIIFAIAYLVIAIQSIKASRINPIDAIRVE